MNDVGHKTDEQARNYGRVIDPATGEVVEGASHNTNEEATGWGRFQEPGTASIGPPLQQYDKELDQ